MHPALSAFSSSNPFPIIINSRYHNQSTCCTDFTNKWCAWLTYKLPCTSVPF